MKRKRRGLLLFQSFTVLITLLLLQPAVPTYACDCAVPDSATEALERADAVFTGKVIKLKKEKMELAALIMVSESWKGTEDSQVIVYTDSSSSCHFSFIEGEEYLLYPFEHDGKFRVINCGRSTVIKNAEEDLLELGAGSKATNTVQLEDDFKNEKIGLIMSLVVPIILILGVVFFRKRKKI